MGSERSEKVVPISPKLVATNAVEARTAFADNVRASLTEGSQAAALSNKIQDLLDSLSGSRQQAMSSVLTLACQLIDLDRQQQGTPSIPSPSLDSELHQQVEKGANEIKRLEGKCASSQLKIDELRSQLEASQKDLAAKNLEAAKLTADAYGLRRDVAGLSQLVKERSNEIDSLNESLTLAREKIAQTQAQIKSLNERIQSLDPVRLDGLTDRLSKLEDDKQSLTDQLFESESARQTTEERADGLEEEISQLKGALATAEELLENAARRERELATPSAAATSPEASAKLSAEVASLKAKIRRYEEDLGKYAAATMQSGQLIETLERGRRELQSDYQKLQKKLDEAEAETAAVRQELKEQRACTARAEGDFGKIREVFRKFREESVENTEDLANDIRQLKTANEALQTELRTAQQEATQSAERNRQAEEGWRHASDELSAAKAEIEKLTRELAERQLNAANLDEARRIASEMQGKLDSAGDFFRQLLNGEAAPQGQPKPPVLYDPDRLEAEMQRRREHQMRVEDLEAEAADALDATKLVIDALEMMTTLTHDEEAHLASSRVEYACLNTILERLQKIKESMSSSRLLLQRVLDAGRLLSQGLPKDLLDGELPAIPKLELPESQTDEKTDGGNGQSDETGLQSPIPPAETQAKSLMLYKLAMDHGLTQETTLIATLYEIIPGKTMRWTINRVVRSAICANIPQVFGWDESRINNLLHGHWRGNCQELKQADRLLVKNQNGNSFIRTSAPLPWDVSCLLTNQEVADFRKWFQSYFK